jgi:hypothetical protein
MVPEGGMDPSLKRSSHNRHCFMSVPSCYKVKLLILKLIILLDLLLFWELAAICG